MVGNDIIDLGETRRSTNWERPGFIQKICTPKEQRFINASADPFTTVWRLWSMKESAYKVFLQMGADRFFNPSSIECEVDSLQSGRVTIAETVLKTNTSIQANYIFSTATLEESGVNNRVFELTETNSKYQSKFMHQQVLNDFAKSKSLDGSALLIQKSKTGVPSLQYKNKPLNTAISITHHGKYGAYSIQENYE
ncbi:MAG: phosphopantetheinyl transferase (holo-ACP synthase) [Flavobacteriales bacterium]|jgi:phosphopantetheinyl transferase (holo-ACP synthase)